MKILTGGVRFCAQERYLYSKWIMALTQKAISARRYRKIKDAGLCPRCGGPKDREGHYCSKCANQQKIYTRENRAFWRKMGICPECGKNKLFGDEKVCPECRAYRAEYRATHPISAEQKKRDKERFRKQQKALYQERKNTGICTRCGKRKAMPGKTKCGICLEKDAEQKRMKTLRNGSVKEYRKENHLCYTCGLPIDRAEGQICQKCWQKFHDNGVRNAARVKIKNPYWKADNKLIFKN